MVKVKILKITTNPLETFLKCGLYGRFSNRPYKGMQLIMQRNLTNQVVILSAAKDLRFWWHRLSSLCGIFGTAWKGCATKNEILRSLHSSE